MARQRIAIVGGGPSGLSTAFHLTQEPGWEKKYDITIYQLGWRVGGKGATGRDDQAGYRILEHGIHGFCNFYFNTWGMMKDAYGGLTAADRKITPIDRIEDGFKPSSLSYQVQFSQGQWHTQVLAMPDTPGHPWDAPPPPLNWKSIVAGLLEHMRKRGRPGPVHRHSHSDLLHPRIGSKKRQEQHRGIGKALHGVFKKLHDKVHEIEEHAIEDFLRMALKELDGMRKKAITLGSELDKDFHKDHSVALAMMDTYWTTLRGILDDRLWTRDLDVLDKEDFRAWLRRHGAMENTLNSSVTFVVPNILFAYPYGDSTRPPELSAASWLAWLLRGMVGRGGYFYFMAAGTGETVILPLYLALKRRGVKFEFFHKLTDITTSSGKNPAVTELHFEVQAKTKSGKPYEPLQKVPGKAWQVWPSHPLWEQLKYGKENAEAGVHFERWAQSPVKGGSKRVLTKGKAGANGFDYVVWAMPPSMIEYVGNDALNKAWADSAGAMRWTATQASQFWLTRSTEELGWKIDRSKFGDSGRYVSGSFPNPLNAMAVFDDLIEYEAWGKDAPRGVIYLCSQLQGPDHGEMINLGGTRASTSSNIRVLGNFMPDAVPTGADCNDPQSIDFNYLFVPKDKDFLRGDDRLALQYHRVNIDPVDAYVQAPPGSAKHRLLPWQSGFSNLVPAGDWIYTGINVGAFESAVTGGKFAAFALAGHLEPEEVYGVEFMHKNVSKAIGQALKSGAVPVVK